MRPLSVRAYPLLEGREEDLRRFVRQLDERRAETDAFYRRYGVARESVHLQRVDGRPVMIAVTEFAAADPAAMAQQYAGSHQAFDAWFKNQIGLLSGIDLDQQPLGPDSELMFDWQGED